MDKESWSVRPAEEADLPEIAKCYENARRFMAAAGNPNQWGTDRPAWARTLADLACGNLYVMEKMGRVHAVFAFLPGPDPTYAHIDGQWASDTPYHVIHRIASDGTYPGVLPAAVEYCRKTADHLRIDTHEQNTVMRRKLKNAGFTCRGVIYLENGEPRLAFDWVK